MMMPTVLFYGLYDLYKRWLQCMRITLAPMIAMIGSMFLHIILCFVFLDVMETGIIGLAYSSVIKDFVLMLSVMIYCRCSSQVNVALVPVNSDAFSGYWQYLSISLPSTVMLSAEIWASQILTVLAGVIGVVPLASYTICINVSISLMMITMGIQEAAAGIFGNCIGANNTPLAERFFSVITKFTMATILSVSTIVYLTRRQIVALYTADEEV